MSSKSRSRREAKQKKQHPAAQVSSEKMKKTPTVQVAASSAAPAKTKETLYATKLKHVCRHLILMGISYVLIFIMWFLVFMGFFMVAFTFLDVPITTYFPDTLAFFVNISPAFFLLSVLSTTIWMVYIGPMAENIFSLIGNKRKALVSMLKNHNLTRQTNKH